MPKKIRQSIIVFSLALVLTFSSSTSGQDGQDDASSIHPSSAHLEHLLALFTIHGVPKNEDTSNPVTILINHGYAAGFSPKYNQPLWVAYQVSNSIRDVNYARFPVFVDDLRLAEANRIGAETFGNNYDRGHLAPNSAINRQFGKLSQMETFLMSNIAPQHKDLNQGVWKKLEDKILDVYPKATAGQYKMNNLWVLVGPIFDENPEFISRPNGTRIAIPTAFFCILVRPFRRSEDSPGNSNYLTFVFNQDVPLNSNLSLGFVTSINAVESRTKLNFLSNLSDLMESRIENAVSERLW